MIEFIEQRIKADDFNYLTEKVGCFKRERGFL